jgi:hypothetical protein
VSGVDRQTPKILLHNFTGKTFLNSKYGYICT